MSKHERSLRATVTFVATCLIVACGSMRPTRPPEALNCGLDRFVVKDVYQPLQAYRARAKALEQTKPSFNVLALSAGGEFGAYGAGFLAGWGSVGNEAKPSPRIDVQVVTGVSTGA